MQVSANGIALEVDDRGPPDGEPLLMIMGLGMQLVAGPRAGRSAGGAGFRVIRFDNRDVGLSQRFDSLGVPNLAAAALRHPWACRWRALPAGRARRRQRGPDRGTRASPKRACLWRLDGRHGGAAPRRGIRSACAA